MGRTDRRQEQGTYQDGSSKLDVGLTAEQAAEALRQAAAEGVPSWYILGELEGGEMGERASEEETRNEADEIVTTSTSEETFEIGNTLLSTDTTTLHFMKYLAAGEYFPMRYPLPAGVDADGNVLHQLWCFHHARVVKEDWNLSTAQGTRTRPFTIRAYKKNDQPLYEVETVRMDEQTGWPENISDFTDDRFAPALAQ